jgi:predicted component of type VI protein secretion system
VTSDPEAGPDVKAQYPLREARIEVRQHPGRPGCYLCTAHLWPHFELDELNTTVKVTTELTAGRPG